MGIVKQSARRLAIAAGMIAAASLIALKPAQAIDAGTAVGIGLGSFAIGSALGSTANPYYNPTTTHTGTPTRRRPIIRRHPIIPAQLLGPLLPTLLRVLSCGAKASGSLKCGNCDPGLRRCG